MNKIVLFLSVLMMSKLALATAPANLELCALEIQEEAEVQFREETIFNIKSAKSISAFHLSLINEYLKEEGNTYTFADLKKLFGPKGEWRFNDLYILKFTSKTSGKTYLEVRAFPGDNPVGTVFDAITGKTVALNSDDSYELIADDGSFSCYKINDGKY